MICFSECISIAKFLLLALFSISAVLFIVCIILLRLTLDRRVRKAMSPDKVFNCPLDAYGGWMRATGFAYAALFERAKRYAMKDYYDGFDVKSFANTFEKTIASIYIISFTVFLLCILTYYITDWFDLLNWK